MFVTLKLNEGNARQAKSTHLLPLTLNVTCAEESVAPRSDCSPTDELIRDQRSVVSTAQSIHMMRKIKQTQKFLPTPTNIVGMGNDVNAVSVTAVCSECQH